jgi:hypothetical protein
MFPILPDHLIRHLADRGAEVASRPEMPPAVAPRDVRKLFEKRARRARLDPPHQLTRCQRRRTTHQDVNVILTHHALHYPHLERFARLAATEHKLNALKEARKASDKDRDIF